jgi:hypothetical protein
VHLVSHLVHAVYKVAVEIPELPAEGETDRALSSLLLSIKVLQMKFEASVDVKVGSWYSSTLASVSLGAAGAKCEDVSCLQEAAKKYLKEELDGSKLRFVKTLEEDKKSKNHFRTTGIEYDAFLFMGNDSVPSVHGFGTKLNMYFLSYEHKDKKHPGKDYYLPAATDDNSLQKMAHAMDSWDCIFIPSPTIHDVYLTGMHAVYKSCREHGFMCPTIMTHNVAGHMYYGVTKDGDNKDIRENPKMREKLYTDLQTILWRYMQAAPYVFCSIVLPSFLSLIHLLLHVCLHALTPPHGTSLTTIPSLLNQSTLLTLLITLQVRSKGKGAVSSVPQLQHQKYDCG